MAFNGKKDKSYDISILSRDQQVLLYTIDYTAKWMKDGDSTIQTDDERVWVKELPLWAIMHYQITNGIYETYDYSPTPIQFFGRSSFTVNLSYEGVDDIEDLRELEILEKIRLSTSQHGFLTAYRITSYGKKLVKHISQDVKDQVHNLFFCKQCKTHLKFYMNMSDNPEIMMDCPDCDVSDVKLEFLESEDVSYISKPYFLRISNLLIRSETDDNQCR